MNVDDIEEPLRTVLGHGGGALVEPFILPQFGEGRPRDIEEPLNTVTTTSRGIGLVEPFMVNMKGRSTVRDLEDPAPTQTAAARHMALVEPFITSMAHTNKEGPRNYPLERPLPTQTGTRTFGLVAPFLVKFYRTGGAHDVEKPLDTVTTKPRYGLVEGTYALDILFRMLQPHELAAAMGFPSGYFFAGTKDEQVRQIGGAVTGNLAEHLGRAMLTA